MLLEAALVSIGRAILLISHAAHQQVSHDHIRNTLTCASELYEQIKIYLVESKLITNELLDTLNNSQVILKQVSESLGSEAYIVDFDSASTSDKNRMMASVGKVLAHKGRTSALTPGM